MKKNLLISIMLLILAGRANSHQCPSSIPCSNFSKLFAAHAFTPESASGPWVHSNINSGTASDQLFFKDSSTAEDVYSLTVTAKNVNGAAKSNAEVILFNDSQIELSTVTANSSGQATFSNLINGTYTYKVYFKPSIPNVPVDDNTEFWGSGTIIINGNNVSETFTRNAPYISAGPTFNPVNLATGQQSSGSFKVKNPLPLPADSYIAIWVDRDKLNPWDNSSNNSDNALSISVGGTSVFPFNVTPTNNGPYFCYAFVYTKIDGTFMITDQYNWTQVFTVAPAPTISQINWSGYTWNVRNGVGGPGPNNWNANPENVWVDNQGNLHLKIIRIEDLWYCSEITLQQSLGYGEYTFEVSSNVENLDKNVVFGIFTYETETKEIDIEFSRWGNSAFPAGWYTIQPPPYNSLNQKSFPLNLSGNYSTHQFKWNSSEIYFRSDHGHGLNNLINQWSYKGVNNPPAGKEKLHLNLWLFQGIEPSNLQGLEVVIKSFKYAPILINSTKEELSDSSKIVLFPNPTKGLVNILADQSLMGDPKIDVYNNNGLLVQSKCISFNKNIAQIDLSGYSNGHYLFKIDVNRHSYLRKMIKE